MAWADAAARGAMPLAASAMLVLALAVLLARRAGVAVALVAAQAGGLAVALVGAAWIQGRWGLAALALATLLGKAVVLPLAARAVVLLLGDGTRLATVAAIGAVGLAGLVVAAVAPGLGMLTGLALAVVAVGGLAVALRRDAAGAAAGVLVMENGVVLVLGTVPGLLAAPWWAVASFVVPAAVLAMLVRRTLAGRGVA